MDWQPIETAPIKHGEGPVTLLLYCPGMRNWYRFSGASDIVVGAWQGYFWECDCGEVDQGYESTGAYFERDQIHPTHWMPLPKPPEAA